MSEALSVATAIKRGLKKLCPVCGKGALYRAYLKPVETCSACEHPLGAYRADDGPAYFTILAVGHLVVAPLLFFPFVWEWSPWIVVPLTVTPLIVLTLLALPRVKGGVIGILAANGIKGDEHQSGEELRGR